MELDLLDRKLIYFLDRDARQGIASVAKRLHIGRNVALYRLNRLMERGIIKGSFAEINNTILGYHSFRIFLKLGKTTESKLSNLFNFVEKNKNILWLSRVLGKWDLDMVFMTKSVGEFEKFRRELFLKFNELIERFEIALLTKICHYPKDYLFGDIRKNMTPSVLDIEKDNACQIDDADEELLSILSKDASINIVDIAQRMKLSINTIKKKIKNLEEKEIILGYRLFLDIEKLGYQYYKLHLSLQNYNEKDIAEISDWLASRSYVVYTDHYINGEDFEIELHLKNELEYIRFWMELNKEFGKIIKDHFYITFYDTRIFKYIPTK